MAKEKSYKGDNEAENNVGKSEDSDVEPSETVEEFNWEKIFEDVGLRGDIERSDEKEDINSSKDFIYQEQKSYIKFDEAFQIFLWNFVDAQNLKEKQKRWLKLFFFLVIMTGFMILIITPCVLIVKADNLSDTSMIVALITVLIELVSAIIVLPKIIAEYLFNKEEDRNMMEIIKSMQSYNEKKHDHFKQRH